LADVNRFQVVPAAYVILRRGDEVLLLLRANTGWMDGHWAVPAGHVEQGESVFEAALREAEEEAGVRIRPDDLRPLCVMHRTVPEPTPIDERVDFFFTADRWSGEPHLREAEKADRLDWFRLDKLPDPVVPHELLVLNGLRDGRLPTVLTFGFTR
jgi:8-oxo-dGTP diphosphatase